MGRFRHRRWLALVAAICLTLVAAACGDDDDDDASSDTGGGGSSTSASEPAGSTSSAAGGGATTTTAAEEEHPVGGEATFLFSSETSGLDSAKFSGFAGENGHRLFAIYGALVTDDPTTGEIVPVMAESFEPDESLTTWTLRLHEGMTFTDGTPFDAAAVQFNWERVADPATASPAIGTAATVESYEVIDPQTLEIHLSSPNAHLDRAAFRSALNYIGSPTAIQSGHDMTADPIAAGPFMVQEWRRDDRLILVRNPDYFDAPRPYLDQLTIRVITVEQQRLDTLLTGDADLMWSPTPASHDAIADEIGGSSTLMTVSGGTGILFNTSQPPFDDVRLRQVFAMALDRDLLAEIARPGTPGATNWAADISPWRSDSGNLPEFDTEGAQALLDEIVADNGGEAVQVRYGTFQVGADPQVAELAQTTLNQLDGIEVTVDPVDVPTAITWVRAGDFQVHVGIPYTDPQPSLFDFLHTGAGGNYSKYSNPDMDAGLDADRAERDMDARLEIWDGLFGILAEELPMIPTLHPIQGVGHTENVDGVVIYQDGVCRWDLVYRTDI